ncbi:hypothetical protein DPMN_193808 [Dreissena polymorpha]|uniref:Uncharacterized protein n=1 Tax=Dreissena polymorpha TaxID=45954 RepID=A0A9D3Y644_DREPO|nr:hypothetical protein DPMN_193808 [Dreissena polymorpha]
MVGTALVAQSLAVGFVGTDQLVAQMGTGKEMVVMVVKLVVSVLEYVAQASTGMATIVVVALLVVSVLELVALTSTGLATVSFPQNKLNLNQ